MPTRIEQLSAMRAPNQSGVDTAAVIKALAGNPQLVATPTTYAYGMNVADAQREGQIGAQAQQQREASIRDARNAAMQQDQQRFDMAMKAHQQYIAERNLAISERVANAELAYKKAKMDGIPGALEAQRLANEKLRLDIEREKEMDSIMVSVPDPSNPGKMRDMPVRAFLGSGGQGILKYLAASAPSDGTPSNETGTERTIKRRAEIYVRKGIDPDDAFLLAASKPESTFAQIGRAIDAEVKSRAPKAAYMQPNYGTRPGPDGKDRKLTLDEFKAEAYDRLIDAYLPMLSEKTRMQLKLWGPGALGLLNSEEEQPGTVPTTGGFSQESIDALTKAMMEAYK